MARRLLREVKKDRMAYHGFKFFRSVMINQMIFCYGLAREFSTKPNVSLIGPDT